jgi:hypothetical protein
MGSAELAGFSGYLSARNCGRPGLVNPALGEPVFRALAICTLASPDEGANSLGKCNRKNRPIIGTRGAVAGQ